jgi:hypothetical protein
MVDHDDPQQMQGYSYADNAPITAADANGMWPNWGKVWHAVSAPVAAVGNFVYDHAGTISTITGIAAMACAVIPPLQAIAPVLGAISAVTGAIDTAKSCIAGQALDCALGVASMIPGGRLLKGGKDVLKDGEDIYKAGKAVHAADELADASKAVPPRGPYIPRDREGNPIPLRQQRVNNTDIPLPDPAAEGRPHTVLGGRVGSDGVVYRQSATFPGGTWPPANGHDVPWSRVDWHDHSRPWDHSNPHQHVFEYDSSRGGWTMGRRTFFGFF